MGTHSNGVNTNSYGSHPGMGAHPIEGRTRQNAENKQTFDFTEKLILRKNSPKW